RLASSIKLAEVSIQVSEVLGGDSVSVVVTPYCGPYEGLAFARANGKADLFVWKDYSTPFLREGKLCEKAQYHETRLTQEVRHLSCMLFAMESTAVQHSCCKRGRRKVRQVSHKNHRVIPQEPYGNPGASSVKASQKKLLFRLFLSMMFDQETISSNSGRNLFIMASSVMAKAVP
ncbi:MAG: hypothetical protein ACE5JO_04525, partial [Candidatus Binatia bacterium]